MTYMPTFEMLNWGIFVNIVSILQANKFPTFGHEKNYQHLILKLEYMYLHKHYCNNVNMKL